MSCHWRGEQISCHRPTKIRIFLRKCHKNLELRPKLCKIPKIRSFMDATPSRRFYSKSQLSSRIEVTPEGYLACYDVPIARVGEMIYTPLDLPFLDETTAISRSADELFSPDTISSFEAKPVTIGHPVDDVDPDTWDQLAVGTMTNVRPGVGEDTDKLMADLLIQKRRGIDYVLERKRAGLPCELSLGYTASYTQDEDGRMQQKRIIGNHLALVQAGRCGPVCAIYDHAPEITTKKMTKKKTLKDWWDSLGKTIDAMPEEGDPTPGQDPDQLKALEDRIAQLEAAQETPGDAAQAQDDAAAPTVDPIAALSQKLDLLIAAVSRLLDAETSEEQDETAEEQDETAVSLDQETISRAEIIAPGIAKTADVKQKALEAAYATADGKKVIDGLLDGRTFDAAKSDSALFVATAAVMGAKRQATYSADRVLDAAPGLVGRPATCDEINRINAAFYAQKN